LIVSWPKNYKESIQAASAYVRSRSQALGIASAMFEKKDIHVHVPEGATPKDGPSAGVAMVTAIISIMTGIPIKKDVAMTGEITLRGRVLPIDGLKEKLLAALRAGIKTVVIPEENVCTAADDDIAVWAFDLPLPGEPQARYSAPCQWAGRSDMVTKDCRSERVGEVGGPCPAAHMGPGLFHDGRDVRKLPLVERKDLLMVLIMGAGDSRLRLSDGFNDGAKLLAAAEWMELEGVVSKRRDAPYRSGTECGWVKVKTQACREANRERWRLFERH
jgi:Lon protease (S16) C-terminal proteolytic domain